MADGDDLPDRTEFLLSQLRCARTRASLYQNEFDSLGISLRAGLMNPDEIILCLRDLGLLDWIIAHPANEFFRDNTNEK